MWSFVWFYIICFLNIIYAMTLFNKLYHNLNPISVNAYLSIFINIMHKKVLFCLLLNYYCVYCLILSNQSSCYKGSLLSSFSLQYCKETLFFKLLIKVFLTKNSGCISVYNNKESLHIIPLHFRTNLF